MFRQPDLMTFLLGAKCPEMTNADFWSACSIWKFCLAPAVQAYDTLVPHVYQYQYGLLRIVPILTCLTFCGLAITCIYTSSIHRTTIDGPQKYGLVTHRRLQVAEVCAIGLAYPLPIATAHLQSLAVEYTCTSLLQLFGFGGAFPALRCFSVRSGRRS